MNKPGGLHIVEPDTEKLNQAINDGQRFIAFSVDMRILDSVAKNAMNSINERK